MSLEGIYKVNEFSNFDGGYAEFVKGGLWMRILILAGHAPSLVNFRGSLLQIRRAAGQEVHTAAPGLMGDITTVEQLRELSIIGHNIPFARTSVNPFADAETFLSIISLIYRIRPDAVMGYMIKPVIWGTPGRPPPASVSRLIIRLTAW